MLTIYKASAGSGKTYTLAYQYIKLLLGKKCEKYGKAFCSLIARHTAENPDEAKAPEGQVSYLERELASFREQVVTQKNCGIYKAWSAEEDRQLRSEISQSMTIEEIAKAHSRSVGAISSRIKKLSEL